MNAANPQEASVSPKFNFPDADVIFKSSDGVLFRVHRKNLEVCTEGFPPGDISTMGDVVELTEASVTLELLFQFIYPQRHPALDTTPFEILEPLAEASEKYQVFPAMNICHIRLRDMVKEHPVEVAVYAAKHDYPYLVSQVAPMMISMDIVKVVGMLPPYLVLPWMRYLQQWTKVYHKIALVSPYGAVVHRTNAPCKASENNAIPWAVLALACMGRLGAGIHTLRTLDAVFDMSPQIVAATNPYNRNMVLAECCKTDLANWRRQIDDGIAKLPAFTHVPYSLVENSVLLQSGCSYSIARPIQARLACLHHHESPRVKVRGRTHLRTTG